MYENGVTMEGYKPLRFLEIVELLEAKAKEVYGNDIRLDPSSRLGQDIQLMAWQESRIQELLHELYTSFYIDTAEAVNLDNNLKLTGLNRKDSIKSRGFITIEGKEGLVIPKGFKVATEDNKVYLTMEESKITEGEANIPIIAEVAGKVGNVPANEIVYQFNPIRDITAVYNKEETYNGTDLEEDYEFRERHYESLSTGGGSSTEAIKAGLLGLEEVIDSDVEENDTMETNEDGIPAKSVHCIVYGGDDQLVAETIFKYKSGGIQAYGEQYFDVVDDDGDVYSVGFTRPKEKDIYVKVKVKPTDGYVGEDTIKRSIVNYIGGFDEDGIKYSGLKQGKGVIYSQVIRSVASLNGVLDVEVELSDNGTDYIISNIEVSRGNIAVTSFNKVVVEYV